MHRWLTGPAIPRARHLLLMVSAAVLPLRAAGAADPPLVLEGERIHTHLDLALGRLRLTRPNGEEVLQVPLGLAVRPGHPPRMFRHAGEDTVQLLTRETAGTEPGPLDACMFQLEADGVATPVRVGVHAGRNGPILTYGIPRAALAGLHFATAGLSFQEGMAVTADDDVVLSAPGRLLLRVDEILGDVPLAEFRLRGAWQATGASAVRLRVFAGGQAEYEGPALAPGDPAAPFDLPLPAAREVTFELTVESADLGAARLASVAFHGPGGRTIPLARVLREDRAGIDLFLDAGGGLELTRVESGGGDPQDGPLTMVDGRNPAGTGLSPPPLLLDFPAPDGTWIGIGLCQVPDAKRFGFTRGRVALSVPTTLLAERLGEHGQVTVQLALLVGRSRTELAEAYRQALVQTGGSPAVRRTASLTVPEWWRRPIVAVAPPPGRGRFARFDAYEVEKQAAAAERRLGLTDFTLLVDGKWNVAHGDPEPSEAFSGLRRLIAAEHVRGRRVLLPWNLFEAEPGSLATLMKAASAGVTDATAGRAFTTYVHEVVRRMISDQSGGLRADGLLFTGLEGVSDPALESVHRDVAAGVGFREIGRALATYRREVRQMDLDVLLAAACGLPQWLDDIDQVVFDATAVPAAEQDDRLARLAAMIPDAPIVVRAAGGAPGELLAWAAKGVAVGVPLIDAGAVAALDEADAATLGAVLALALRRPLGSPERLADGRWRMSHDGRIHAETLADDAGVVVFPAQREAELVLVRTGDVPLPFRATGVLEGDGARVEIQGDGAVLKGAVVGRRYRFSVGS